MIGWKYHTSNLLYSFNYNETKKQKAEKSSDLSVLKTKKKCKNECSTKKPRRKMGSLTKNCFI